MVHITLLDTCNPLTVHQTLLCHTHLHIHRCTCRCHSLKYLFNPGPDSQPSLAEVDIRKYLLK
jgi:hypothetical protein